MEVFAKVVAIRQREQITTGDNRILTPYEIALSVPELRTGLTTGAPYIEGRIIAADLLLSPGEQCTLTKGSHIVAQISINARYLEDKQRYFNSFKLVKYVDLGAINWTW